MTMSLVFSLLFFILCPAFSTARHVITFRSSTPLQLSSLSWDPIAQHFVVGSATGPTVHAISDAGVVEHLFSDPSAAGAHGTVASVVVDHERRRFIVAFSNPGSVAAYDLKSYGRIFAVPLPEMDTVPGGIGVDLRSGEAFVSSTKRGIVWKVGLQGTVEVLSVSKNYGDQGLGGVVHVSRGYLLVLQVQFRDYNFLWCASVFIFIYCHNRGHASRTDLFFLFNQLNFPIGIQLNKIDIAHVVFILCLS
jgi:hypothetical protein